MYKFVSGSGFREKPQSELPAVAVWDGFTENTTAHGIPHIKNARGPIKITFWSLVSMACMAGLCYNMYIQVSKYLDYQVKVLVDIKYEKDMLFPAITVCNHNPIKRKSINKPELETMLFGTQTNDITTAAPSAVAQNLAGVIGSATVTSPQGPAVTQTGAGAGEITTAAPGPMRKRRQAPPPTGPAPTTTTTPSPGPGPGPGPAPSPTSGPAPAPEPATTEGTGPAPGPAPSLTTAPPPGPAPSPTGPAPAPGPTSSPTGPAPAPGPTSSPTGPAPAPGPTSSPTGPAPAPGPTSSPTGPAPAPGPAAEPTSSASGPTPAPGPGPVLTTTPSPVGSGPAPAPSGEGDSPPPSSGDGELAPPPSGDGELAPPPTGDGELAPPPSGDGELAPPPSGDGELAPPPSEDEETAPSADDQPAEDGFGYGDKKGFDMGERKAPDGRKQRANFEMKMKVMKMLADMPDDVKSPMGYPRDDLIIDCEYGGYECIMDNDFTTFYNNMYGNCYTFNSGWNESNPVKLSYRPGPQYGLALTFNIDQDEYIGDLAETAGVRIVIHAQESMPFPEDEGISVGPGELTYVGINMVNITRKGGKYGDCVITDTHNYTRSVFEEIYPVEYTTSACYKTCYQTYVIERCGCGDSQYPFYGEAFGYRNVSACDISNAVDVACMDNVTDDYQADMLPCDCLLSCHERAYAPTVSSAMWPSEDYRNSLFESLASSNENIRRVLNEPNDPDKYQKNLVKAVIYFREFNYEAIVEYPAYEGGSFASDLGGVLGLYLGFSVMTIMEFVEVVIDMMGLIMMKLTMRRPRRRLGPLKTSKEPFGGEIQTNQQTDFEKMQLKAKQEKQFVYDNMPRTPLPGEVM